MRLDQFQDVPESEVDKGIESIVTLFSADHWAIIGIALLLLASIAFALFLYYRRPNVKRIAFALCLTFIIIASGSFILAQTQMDSINKTVYAIIFEKEKPLLEEPNPKSTQLLNLHEGTKIQILDQFRSYYQVELPDGTVGWMTTENIKEI
jgi:hypothetical protein